jgi:hypothetical protein
MELMTVGIIHAFLGWVLGVFAPGTGRRRAGGPPSFEGPVWRPDVESLPAHRSPYGLHGPLDGAASVMVRPYVVEAERECERARQHRRRVALVLAADFGFDLDRHVVGAQGAA